jgi:hypothetical protein
MITGSDRIQLEAFIRTDADLAGNFYGCTVLQWCHTVPLGDGSYLGVSR